MTRLTITRSEGRHLALREARSKRRKAIGQLIEESLELDGIKTTRSGMQLVANARARILSEADALCLAVAKTRAMRRQ